MLDCQRENDIAHRQIDFNVFVVSKASFNSKILKMDGTDTKDRSNDNSITLLEQTDFRRIWDMFLNYYTLKHDKILVELNVAYGIVIVEFNTCVKVYKISCSTIQALILLQFNHKEHTYLTKQEIAKKTGINPLTIAENLMTLVESAILEEETIGNEILKYKANVNLKKNKLNIQT
mmetsp:Transcript_53271/g.116300  ORF Transcript_53271/g.116300 Transcript_53271/m.116300 type:complete len:176 (-) Transcript_53271:294-821(-)